MSNDTDFSLAGNTALVTGSAGNIGAAIAERLAAAGADVVAHCRRDTGTLDALKRRIEADGGACRAIAANLEDAAAIRGLFAELDEAGVTADLLVNNAALQPVESFDDLTYEDWRRMHAVNVDAAFLLTQLAAERMSAGAIVNVASIEALDPAPDHAHYASSKAALEMLTRASAQALGARSIRVNTVSPGLIDRVGLDEAWPEGVDRWRARAPLKRLGSARDVARAVHFLLSPAAGWITGANLVVDGGMRCAPRW